MARLGGILLKGDIKRRHGSALGAPVPLVRFFYNFSPGAAREAQNSLLLGKSPAKMTREEARHRVPRFEKVRTHTLRGFF